MEGYRDPYSRKKFVYLSSIGEGQLSLKENPTSVSNETLIHDLKVSEITRYLYERGMLDEVELEHEIHDKRNFRLTYKIIPDAILYLEKKGHKFKIAFELELTRKSNQRLIEKMKQYEDSSFYNYAMYLFPSRNLMETMQRDHFPTLATSTKMIWTRRYKLLELIEHLPMDKITPSKVTSWVNHWVAEFSNEEYQANRGQAGRCNLNNELNMFVTIFNWYKDSEKYEKEALFLTNPVKKKHRLLGFIKPVPDKKKQIDLEDAFLFFEYLQPLYKSIAMLQFYCASSPFQKTKSQDLFSSQMKYWNYSSSERRSENLVATMFSTLRGSP